MEKTHHHSSSSAESSATSSEHYLKHLNKLSHKISKPPLRKHPLDPLVPDQPDQSLAQSTAAVNQNQPAQLQAPPPPQAQPPQQPPVYNINKNDFRDVVQKLTGSTSHDRAPTPPPPPQQQQQQQQPQVQAPKPPSSRLHRIRPPPLAQLINRPNGLVSQQQQQQTSMLNPNILHPMNSLNGTMNPNNVMSSGFNPMGRPVAPLSPLPPLPSVHAAAESPVSAYMRRLQGTIAAVDPRLDQFTGFGPLAPLASPRWSNLAPPPPQQQQQQQVAAPGEGSIPPPPEPAAQLQLPPSSPMPFGCLNSPRSAYTLLSPGFLFSPTSGQLGFPQLPLSPTVPVSSPGDRGL
ncbi:VQ motif-containing protein 9-like [Syzygium oleosum]|uniref:VQ motif-containing protein 9-like n=1 Tax=Syzygium oleosum TaxID=219896 RepID=UPI0024BAAD21|nr:VQ motif-containing protein 9-like [Syzygium oleosum]